MSNVKKTKKTERQAKKSRRYLSQADVPSYSLEQALRVATAINENYGGHPVTPLQLAAAMMIQPTSGPFRQICGASIAYGLTQGGYNANEITLEPLGKRIVRHHEDADELAAKREATLRPRVMREFLQKYNGSPLPRHDVAKSVLVDMGVPQEKAEFSHRLILDSAQSVGFLREIKGKQYVELAGTQTLEHQTTHDDAPEFQEEINGLGLPRNASSQDKKETTNESSSAMAARAIKRVFITHGKNRAFIEPIKKLLGFGEMIPVVSVESQSVSKPVPEKVMDDMRSCGAAIIHVESEQTLIDKHGQEHPVVNPNVLIEIGAAMALYGRRFILLVRDDVRVPSNLQGLFEVRYTGDTLDGETTIRLLEAINDIKNHPLPKRSVEAELGA